MSSDTKSETPCHDCQKIPKLEKIVLQAFGHPKLTTVCTDCFGEYEIYEVMERENKYIHLYTPEGTELIVLDPEDTAMLEEVRDSFSSIIIVRRIKIATPLVTV